MRYRRHNGLLDRNELKAVLGHEMSPHQESRCPHDNAALVIPIILYRIAWQFLFFGDSGIGVSPIRCSSASSHSYSIFLTNLLVLYASRIREYFADKGSIDLGNKPSALASALYKLVYGSARMPKEADQGCRGDEGILRQRSVESALGIQDLKALDLDKNGVISDSELMALQNKDVKLGFGDRLMELLSTHRTCSSVSSASATGRRRKIFSMQQPNVLCRVVCSGRAIF